MDAHSVSPSGVKILCGLLGTVGSHLKFFLFSLRLMADHLCVKTALKI